MSSLIVRAVAVVVITAGLLIPLAWIRGLIRERAEYRHTARSDIARSWTGAQTVTGPVLVVPPRRTPAEPGEKRRAPEPLFVAPRIVEIHASLRTETRRRGLYEVPVYTAHLTIAGEFDLSDPLPAGRTGWGELEPGEAFLALSFSDNRGIVRPPTLSWDGRQTELVAGSRIPAAAEGVHAPLSPMDVTSSGRRTFHVEVELRGMETLEFTPVGDETVVAVEAPWPHPSFTGRFLPVDYEVGPERFAATWRVSGLATRQPGSWFGEGGFRLAEGRFGVSLIEPVDLYQQAMRSVKYGALIVVLTFTAFFLIELAPRELLHPVHYLLVGLALVMFFALLLALSEHVGFGVAYLAATVACVGLVSVYMFSVVRRGSIAVSLTAGLGGLYAMLFVILRSEDYALLMGSLLLFAALAVVMLVTRRLDWYGIERRLRAPGDVGAAPRTPPASSER